LAYRPADGSLCLTDEGRLIAAGPDVLASLQAILADPDVANTFNTAEKRLGIYSDTSIPKFNEWCKRTKLLAVNARAAIAAATGETP